MHTYFYANNKINKDSFQGCLLGQVLIVVIIFFVFLGPTGWPSRPINLGMTTKIGSIQPCRKVDGSGVIPWISGCCVSSWPGQQQVTIQHTPWAILGNDWTPKSQDQLSSFSSFKARAEQGLCLNLTTGYILPDTYPPPDPLSPPLSCTLYLPRVLSFCSSNTVSSFPDLEPIPWLFVLPRIEFSMIFTWSLLSYYSDSNSNATLSK